MYQYIRNNNNIQDCLAIYGLDADLIMLSIFHLKYSKNIYVFRETPEFFRNLVQIETASMNEPHFLDIRQLSVSILCEMNCRFSHQHRINDYVFLCFFLGNDFLPHFPAMNIRTHGITALLDIYRGCIGNYNDRYFICPNSGKIQWKNVGILIKEVARNEHQLFLTEYNVRKKFDKFVFVEKTPEEKDNIVLNAPIVCRAEEKYICPEESYWEDRYYRVLFHMDRTYENIQNISKNYFEGLEWVYRYYNEDCPNWKWKYNYHYPPLFSDLCKFVPKDGAEILSPEGGCVSPIMQLCYVLPRTNLRLLPKRVEETIKNHYLHLYPERFEFKWAFCRYFWEAHPILPEITLDLLKKIENGP
jgi:5'-3' exonuclease